MLFSEAKSARRIPAFMLSVAIGISSLLSIPAQADTGRALHVPQQMPPARREAARGYEPDILLVMPNAKAESDDIKQTLQEAHGTVIGSLGQGNLKVLVVKTEKGKLTETETKLRKDRKDFYTIQRNYYESAQMVPNDPQFANEWHLPAVNAQKAWDVTQGVGTKIAILDSGCQASVPDLAGKTEKGYDASTWEAQALAIGAELDPLGTSIGMAIDNATTSGARTDAQGHGTMVATTAAATDNNMQNGAGVAPLSTVVPIKISLGSSGQTNDLAIMAALLNIMMTHKAKIVNVSYGPLTNPWEHTALHAYFWTFHHVYGGLVFASAGNDSAYMSNGQMDYLQVVSAVDPALNKANFSNWGNCVKFTAPGVNIVLTDRTGTSVTAAGTSFSSPICAGIAALVWSANPGLSNDQVVNIMKDTATRASSGAWTPFFGFGMPDAFAAVQRARS